MSIANDQEIPNGRTLSKLRWTRQRARETPWVRWEGETPYVGNRRLVLPGQEDKILRQEVQSRGIPPTIGYLRCFSDLRKRYCGLSRACVRAFLRKHKECPQKLISFTPLSFRTTCGQRASGSAVIKCCHN